MPDLSSDRAPRGLRIVAVACFLLMFCSMSFAAARPNIIIILSDDMGFSDLGCYGGEIHTPNLDHLAADGLRFTQFYNCARCCPSRACLLSGLYPHQADIGHMTEDRHRPGYRGDLSAHCVTIAQVLRPAGYSTYQVGKWHVTRYTTPDGPDANWPRQRGFDHSYGTLTGAGSFFDPSRLVRDNVFISPYADPGYAPRGAYYYTDAIADNACQYIDEQCRTSRDKPFFMYVAFTAAHWPMQAPADEIAKYAGKYDGGYEPVRLARFERLKQMGLINPRWDLSPQAEDWNNVPDEKWEARCMEVYAAMVDRMDQGIGRIVQTLSRDGKLDDTLILFLEDNGGNYEPMGRNGTGRRLAQPSLPKLPADYKQMDMIPRQTRDGWPVLQGRGVLPGPADTYIAYGRGWANVSNTPFREYKHFVHEGGISTPLIAHWPDHIKRHGELVTEPAHLIDLMATCVDLAGATYPKTHGANAVTPPEGLSLVPLFDGKTIQRDAIYWEHEGNRAMRQGKWKLVAKYPSGKWELYDMDADRTEMHDLSARQPKLTEELRKKWEAWADRTHVLPWPWKPPYGQKEQPIGSAARHFDLKPGDNLPPARAPRVVGNSISVAARVLEPGEGVILAHGGSAVGYALYVMDGRLCFAVRSHDELTVVQSKQPLPSGPFKAEAKLAANGAMTLSLDGKPAGVAHAPGSIEHAPLDGLQIGRDTNAPVGPYKAPFPFQGKIDSVTIDVGK